MKKSLIALMLAGMMALMALTACATAPMHATVNESVDTIEDVTEAADTTPEMATNLPEFLSFAGTIIEIRPFYDFTAAGEVAVEGKFFVLLAGEANAEGYAPTVNFLVDQNTLLLADVDLALGLTMIGFYDATLPMPLIYPPQHQARVLRQINDGYGVAVDRFDAELKAFNYPWQLEIAESTEIIFEDGRLFDGDISELANRVLVVLYDTDSLPYCGDVVMVTPTKIVILFERAVHPIHILTEEELAEMALSEDNTGFASIDTSWGGGFQLSQEDIDMMLDAMFDPETVQVIINGEVVPMPTPFINREAGFAMVPVADIAEALGYDVSIVSDTEIMIGRSMVTVGVDSYAFGRMAAVELGAAPEVHDGVIFVPLHFFGIVFPYGSYIMDGNIFIEDLELEQ